MFINNQNLGRYWNIGPQETLYLPGAWLDVGLNKVGACPLGPLLSPALPAPPRFPGGLGGRERTDVYLWLLHIVIQQKPTKHR